MNQIATVCGWGSEDMRMNIKLECAEVSENLHCLTVTLYGEKYCRVRTPQGDYQRKLLCGMSEYSAQMTTLVNKS